MDTLAIQMLMSLALSTGDPDLVECLDECNFTRTDWTGAFSMEDWSPATGENLVEDDHLRELARGMVQFQEALADFGVDPALDSIVEAYMERTAPPMTKRRIIRR